MNCQFCQQECKLEDKWLGQWWCQNCQVHYQYYTDGKKLDLIAFTVYNNDLKYMLTINYKTKCTILNILPGDKQNGTNTIKFLPGICWKGITPNNIRSKIQTLIHFQ